MIVTCRMLAKARRNVCPSRLPTGFVSVNPDITTGRHDSITTARILNEMLIISWTLNAKEMKETMMCAKLQMLCHNQSHATYFSSFCTQHCLQCWLGGRKGIRLVKTEWWGTGMVICLELGATYLHYGPADATTTPSSLAPVKFENGLPFWCRLTQVVLEKRPLNGCSSSSRVVVSVLRWSRDVSMSRLGLVSTKIVNVSVLAIDVSCPRPIFSQILQVSIIKLIKSVVAVNDRVFSRAGLIMRPTCSRLSKANLSKLVFQNSND